jgi:TolA-binding protein
MRRAVFIMLCILVASSFLAAQDWKGQGRLAGVVLDEQGKPIAGVRVKLFIPQYNGGFEVTTNSEGKWTAAWMRSGMWTLDFSKLGYMPVNKSFQMNQFVKNKELDVVMKKVEGLVVTDDMKKDLTAANDLYDNKDFAGAITAYKAFLVKFPDAYFIWTNIGNSFFSMEKYEEAEAAYKEVLAKDANNVEAIISVGNCYANRGDQDKAMEWYAKVSFDKISDSGMLYSIGLAYFKASKLDEAQKFLAKAVELNENDTDAIFQLGLTFTALQNKEEAIAVFEKYLKVDPDSERAGQVKGFLDYLKKK